jgi:hypothetical protein
MRERLIAIIKDSLFKHIDKSCLLAENIADDLLENGVVVLLCKVGDTVYQTDGIRIYELEVFDVSIRRNKPYYETESIDFDDDAIGKTVFLTREEAEAKLKGGEE